MGVRVAATWAAALLAGAPAQAEWMQATSRHFIVYADGDAASIKRRATELERFDALLRKWWPTAKGDADAEANRVTVYVLPDVEAIEKLIGRQGVAGFYVPRVSGSVAFTPREDNGDGLGALKGRTILFHEYAHHFLLGNYAVAYPAWYSEGFAEFTGTAMTRGDRMWLGASANHRGYGLMEGRGISIQQLLAPPDRMDGQQLDALYGRGWLLTHYLMFNKARGGQLARYIDRFNAGTPSVEAGRQVFGDLPALDRELDGYLERRSLPALSTPIADLGDPKVEVRPLSAGERALIGWRIRSTRGTSAKIAPAIYAAARAAAAPFAGDAVAQGWLAEMAFDADQLDAADAASDAALAADPKSVQALLYKARVRLARAEKAKAAATQWTEARSWIVRASRADPGNPAALALYYQSFGEEGIAPTPTAIAGLYRANELVPQDASVRFTAARQLVIDGDVTRAKALLRTLASDPHGGRDNPAGRLLAALDAGQTGPAALDALARAADKAGTDKEN